MKFLVALLLLAGAHFTLTANVPAPSGKEWILWPFARDSQAILHLAGGRIANFTKLLSVIAGVCFLAAIMALFGWVFPAEWWSALVAIGSIAALALFLLFLGPWTIIPIIIDLFLLWGVFFAHWTAAMLRGA